MDINEQIRKFLKEQGVSIDKLTKLSEDELQELHRKKPAKLRDAIKEKYFRNKVVPDPKLMPFLKKNA